jgi:hypothetical protein
MKERNLEIAEALLEFVNLMQKENEESMSTPPILNHI